MGLDELQRVIRQRLDEGESVASIAQELGIMRRTVRRCGPPAAELSVREAGRRGSQVRWETGDRWWADSDEDCDWATIRQRLAALEERLLSEGPGAHGID